MEMGLIALLISLSALFMYINYRYLKLPETILTVKPLIKYFLRDENK